MARAPQAPSVQTDRWWAWAGSRPGCGRQVATCLLHLSVSSLTPKIIPEPQGRCSPRGKESSFQPSLDPPFSGSSLCRLRPGCRIPPPGHTTLWPQWTPFSPVNEPSLAIGLCPHCPLPGVHSPAPPLCPEYTPLPPISAWLLGSHPQVWTGSCCLQEAFLTATSSQM